ncbi:hypothetical protein PACTADRAFT_41164 [Pachysolen tannophilus NRRL Y-2460]|uniref:Ferroxidase n=1 Tax=Pachysolen tannophilus NRRL Y-2460 TaxID=669874 RepID=A0A1E4TXF9_PACTA|nr:hypothetical protein PACTADRAFT_41164 [Pachysolen tannophilus NRRL Y-2460]
MYFATPVWLILCFASLCCAEAATHVFHFNASWIRASPDGVMERDVISFNNQFPLPTIEVNKGDTVLLYLYNGLETVNTSLHFHGIFQHGTVGNDGPEMVTQCPIPPGETMLYNFTVDGQRGTYWYHSHTNMQYSDGLRGAFVIKDDEFMSENYQDYDEEKTLTITDWFYDPSWILEEKYKSRYNPTGAEPIPQNILLNDSRNVSLSVETNTTYLLHIVNTGIFVSQYLYIEDHEFTIVEIDGVFVKPNKTDVIYLAVGQRMSVFITTKVNNNKNYKFIQVLDDEMLDLLPDELELYGTNWLVYNEAASKEKLSKKVFESDFTKSKLEERLISDYYLQPMENIELLDDSDYQISLNLEMNNLGDGISYALLNNKTYVAPKIPTLFTAVSSGELANDIEIYGSNTNSYILQKDEVIDIIINNYDSGKHPFHLHGHNFQILYRSPPYEDPVPYDMSKQPEFPQRPSVRDTVMLEPYGNMIIRFKAINPGVWFFHCHVDYHVASQGLAVTFIESPFEIQKLFQTHDNFISENHFQICKSANVATSGNAAGNSINFKDLTGENVQPMPLPPGFTLKGYVALIISILTALYGLKTIKEYGMEDTNKLDEKEVIEKLKDILRQNGAASNINNFEQLDSELNRISEEIDERTFLGPNGHQQETDH